VSATANLEMWSTLMKAPAVPPAERPLSAAMRAGSQKEHDAAERSPFVHELIEGNLNRDGYVDYLLRLQVVYAALEDAVRAHRDDPLVAVVYDPALERLSAIDADLRYWADGSPPTVNSPAAEAYRGRLESIRWSGALLAHHYTRYIGDLSGGRIIRRALNRAFNLGGVGLAFYDFPMQAKPFKDSYRARLDALALQTEQVDEVVGEVKLAFGLNQALFDELAGNLAAYCEQHKPTVKQVDLRVGKGRGRSIGGVADVET
jgi:heme oxygenase (biliverdin-producing, ferredoxin)